MGLLAPTSVHFLDNHAGWRLELRTFRDAHTLVPGRRPLVFVPGYAMNGTPLVFHPGGPSLVEHLVGQGFECWIAHLRGQGASAPIGRPATFGMAELALDDLPLVFDHVLAETRTGADAIDAIGCSLGATLVYGYLAHHPHDHRVGRMVAIGGPLRWTSPHPLMRLAFASPRLAGALRFSGTRTLARVALPLLKRVPWALSIYLNADGVDLDAADQLVETVEDPIPAINVEIARWVSQVDLRLRDVDVTGALGEVRELRVLSVLANRDGIVPPSAARSVVDALGPDRVDLITAGTDARWYAHADLFVGRRAQAEVFAPIGEWLVGQQRDADHPLEEAS